MSEPIRVLHILQRMEAGGTQALLMNIYRKIDRTKVQFDFLVEYPEKQFYDDEITEMGGKIYYSTVREDFNVFKFMRQLKTILNEHPEYRIVHSHAFTIGYFCLKTAKKCGVPVRIAHSHSNETMHDIKWIPKLIMQKLYTIHATDLFACSEEAGKYLFKNRPFSVLKNAINSSKFVSDGRIREEVRNELGVNDNFVVGHVGRFHTSKNHSFLIDVFAQIKKKKTNAKLILIGSGDLEQNIRNKAERLSLTDSIVFLGNRADMERIYQAMDVFVFPSIFEGLGIVAIEAQAAGIPVICSEGLPPESNVTPLYKKLMLSYGAEKWALEALSIVEEPQCHSNMQQYIIDAGFDMKSTAAEMERFYLDKHYEK
ncbi:MAG: glycosyltransferase family 1 protein [Ruminococcus sp.]|nr:glycosyltransferase family 1 protein [Ruminococcus sp.]